MKFLQKRPVAIVITVLAIALGIGLGQLRANRAPAPPSTGETALDTSLSTAAYETWIWDEANVFSSGEEKNICLYNANWDQRYTSLLAVAAVKSVDGDIADYAYELGNEIGASGTPCILIPSPNVTNDHQTKNARILAQRGGAIMLPEQENMGQKIYDTVTELLADPERLSQMSVTLRQSVVLDSAERICDMIEQLCAER